MNKHTVENATAYLSAVMKADAQDLNLVVDNSRNRKQPVIYFSYKTEKSLLRVANRVAKSVGGQKVRYRDGHGTQYVIDLDRKRRITLEQKWYEDAIDVAIMQFNRKSNRHH